MAQKIKNVLILGCGRSGTSIFGELFDHLPQYQYYSEPYFDHLDKLDFTAPVALKVPRESEKFMSDPGLSIPLEQFNTLADGNWQIFWIVRHPLDAITSLKVGISRDWGHHPRPPDWKEWLDKELILRCGHHWNYINSIGYQQVKEVCITVHFEEMLIDSLAFAENVVNATGLTLNSCKKELQEWASRVQNTNNNSFVEAQTSKAYSTTDHKVKVGRWKENLTNQEIKSVMPLLTQTAGIFDYEL